MTLSILNETLLLRKNPPKEMQDYFKSINLIIFNEIYEQLNPQEAHQTILYILCAYSEDSPLLIIRQDSNEEKEGICDYLEIPDFMRGKLKQLSDRNVRHATTQYILQFAGPLFKAFKLMDIQLEDLNLAITNREYIVQPKEEKAKEGEEPKETTILLYDWKEHAKAVMQYEVLSKKKDTLERELKNQLAYKAINELKEYKFHNLDKKIVATKDGICLESSKLIKIGRG